jgi:hypothetical protein
LLNHGLHGEDGEVADVEVFEARKLREELAADSLGEGITTEFSLTIGRLRSLMAWAAWRVKRAIREGLGSPLLLFSGLLDSYYPRNVIEGDAVILPKHEIGRTLGAMALPTVSS